MSNSRGTSAKKSAKVVEAFDLRCRGYRFRDIGKAIGVSSTTAFRYVSEELKRLAKEAREGAEQLRAIEHTRLEDSYREAQFGIQRTRNSDTGAHVRYLETARKISESIRKLYGLDAPEEHKHELTWADLAKAAAEEETE